MNSLELRKQLLMAESEINRAQLVQEWQTMAEELHYATGRAKSIGSIASSTAVLVAGLATFRRGKPAGAGAKTSWLQMILKGAGLVSAFWLAFRSQSRNRTE